MKNRCLLWKNVFCIYEISSYYKLIQKQFMVLRFYWLISYYCNIVGLLLQESSRAHQFFNVIFYLNFRKELLILVEANFSHLLHCPHFLLSFIKKLLFSKIFFYPKSLCYKFNLNQKRRKLSAPLYRPRIGISLMQKGYFTICL